MDVYHDQLKHGDKIKAKIHTIKLVTICNPILMPKPNPNPNSIDGEVLKRVKIFKYLGRQYLGILPLLFCTRSNGRLRVVSICRITKERDRACFRLKHKTDFIVIHGITKTNSGRLPSLGSWTQGTYHVIAQICAGDCSVAMGAEKGHPK